jgi:hypothetical protein
MRAPDLLGVPLVAILLAAAPAEAQQPRPAQDGQQARPQPVATSTATPSAEPRLVFDREVFLYPGRTRRDPFRPLTSTAEGPLFTDLKLHMILYSEDPRSSVVAVSDATNRQYRLRRGDSVGNATVVDIGPTRVVFSVLDFGIRRQEVLDMKDRGRERSR